MKLVGSSCKTHEVSQNSLGDTKSFLHQEPALCILSLEACAGHQNKNFFCQRTAKMAVLFNRRFLCKTELTQLLIIGLNEGKQQCPLFKHFSASVINLFFTLSMNHLKFKATERLLKVIRNMVMGIWSYGIMFWLFYHLKMNLLKLKMCNVH